MSYIRLVQSVNTLDGPQLFTITAMIHKTDKLDEFITISHDGLIKIWNTETLKLVTSSRIKSGYLMSIIPFQQGYLVGIGNGEIVKFDGNFNQLWAKKVHEDCVTGIVESEKYLITVGFDGKVCFMDKNKFDIVKEIELSIPFYRMCLIQGSVYISGNPSFKINVQTFEVTQLSRTDVILLYKNKAIGCSDDKGLQLMDKKTTQIHGSFNFILNYKNQKIIALQQKMIALADISKVESEQDQYEFSYKIFKAECLSEGYAIYAGIVKDDNIIVAGEDGYIYKFKVE